MGILDNFTLPQLHAMADYSYGLGMVTIDNTGLHQGLCESLKMLLINVGLYDRTRRESQCPYALVTHLAKSWDERSGNPDYPVRHPYTQDADLAFYGSNREMLWVGEYGAARKRLCLHVAARIRVFIAANFPADVQAIAHHPV